ncbi:MAG: LamG domain-containing protein [Oscillochloris sp.]|nr:LamG domain-containing protein [Oscillochloris sp.]
MIDRDVFGPGDTGDYGVALRGGRVVFGVAQGSQEFDLCGTTVVTDGAWHHIALTRATNGQMRIYVDGQRDASGNGPSGDVAYREGRATQYANDPYLVLGAEKHDFGPEYPSFSGWMDELRISTEVRYSDTFTVPAGPWSSDASTVGLYHFDAGSGTQVADSAGATGGPSDGVLRVGGAPGGPQGPIWSSDTPWNTVAPTVTPQASATPVRTPDFDHRLYLVLL